MKVLYLFYKSLKPPFILICVRAHCPMKILLWHLASFYWSVDVLNCTKSDASHQRGRFEGRLHTKGTLFNEKKKTKLASCFEVIHKTVLFNHTTFVHRRKQVKYVVFAVISEPNKGWRPLASLTDNRWTILTKLHTFPTPGHSQNTCRTVMVAAKCYQCNKYLKLKLIVGVYFHL